MSFYDYKPYVSAEDKKAKNEALAKRLARKNPNLKPVTIQGRSIAKTFWGKAWCDNVESYQDYASRLPRGRSYVRAGAVVDLQISEGRVDALVAGSRRAPYKVAIAIKPLSKAKWEALKAKCVGKISSVLALVQGKLPPEILAEFCDKKSGLFPSPQEIDTGCSCPDWAGLCKHLAAVFYAIGARLDEDPSLFFTLRGVDEKELLGAVAAETLTDGVASEIAPESLEDVFGVEFDGVSEPAAEAVKPVKKARKRKAVVPEQPPKAAETAEDQESAVPSADRRAQVSKKRSAARPALPAEEGAAPAAWTSERVAELRRRSGLTLTEFGRLCKTMPGTIANWERGVHRVSVRFWKRLNDISQDVGVQNASAAKAPAKTKDASAEWTAERVLALRRLLGLSRSKFGGRAGVAMQTVANWEKGTSPVREKYCAALNELEKESGDIPASAVKA